jgi:hypothetical protein
VQNFLATYLVTSYYGGEIRGRCFAFLVSLSCKMPIWSDPSMGVDSRETVQVRQVRRRDGDGIPWLAGERRLAGKDSIGIESVGRRRGDGRLSEESPGLSGLDR